MSEKDVRISYIAARNNAKLSRESAAKQLNISVFTLANYETGKTIPDWDKHYAMAELYNLPPEMLCPPQK